MRKGSCSNLWNNSNDTIEWFKKIKNKSKAIFTQFDIIDFYPSITKNTLIDSINYARKYVEITEEQYKIILACRKTVLTNDRSMWVKTDSQNFDVPMGGYYSSQIADQMDLYHNDGIIYIPNSDGSNSSCI